jgi:hypothetical protein
MRAPVIVAPQDVRLPDVLKHIEAGRIVLVVPPCNRPDEPSGEQPQGLTRRDPG